VKIALIDFDKSILSHHHHNYFDMIARKINEEVGIVFDSVKSTIVSDYNHIFNCYVMYDVLRFALVMKQILLDTKESIAEISNRIDISAQEEFLDKLIKASSDTLYKIFDSDAKFPFDITDPHGSIMWIIETLFKEYIKINKSKSSIETASQLAKTHSSISDHKPEFISSRRKYADKLKYSFLSEYISKNKVDMD
jgi:hypothetical protein